MLVRDFILALNFLFDRPFNFTLKSGDDPETHENWQNFYIKDSITCVYLTIHRLRFYLQNKTSPCAA